MSAEKLAVEPFKSVGTPVKPPSTSVDDGLEAPAQAWAVTHESCSEDLPLSSAEVRTARGRPKPGARSAAIRAVLRSHLAAHGGALYAFLARLWATLMWLGLIALVVARLSPEVQGYFFAFSSLLLLQVFLEVGFRVVLLQLVSHEWAFLRFGPRGQIEGSPAAAARLASLVRLCREAGRPSSATSNVSFSAVTPLLRPRSISIA